MRLYLEMRESKARLRMGSVICCALFFMAVGTVCLASEAYSIQVGTYSTSEDASAAEQRFSQSCSPVYVVSTGDSAKPYAVDVGHFEMRSEAWVYSTRLSGDGGTTPTVATLPVEPSGPMASQTPGTGTETTLPVEMPFNTQASLSKDTRSVHQIAQDIGVMGGGAVSDTLVQEPTDQLSHDELLTVGVNAPRNPAGVPALERFLTLYPSDSASNRARIRLARRLFGRKQYDEADTLLSAVKTNGTTEERGLATLYQAYGKLYRGPDTEAEAAFRGVANDTSLPASLRDEAMQRAASLAHVQNDYPTAWLMFDQIEKSSSDPAVAAEARMQKAGLAFELTKRGEGTWKETEGLCTSVLQLDGATTRTKATANLMYLEALYSEGRVSDALDEVTRFLAAYPDVPREYYMALAWKGIFLSALQRYGEAESAFAQVVASTIPPGEKFAGSEPKAFAAYWLAWLAQRRGDVQEETRQLNYLVENFPSYFLGREARRWLDALGSTAQ